MDKVLASTIRANLKSAHTQDEKINALVLSLIAVVDSQLQSEQKVDLMWEERGRVRWLGSLVWGLATGGGFAVAVKAMKMAGAL